MNHRNVCLCVLTLLKACSGPLKNVHHSLLRKQPKTETIHEEQQFPHPFQPSLNWVRQNPLRSVSQCTVVTLSNMFSLCLFIFEVVHCALHTETHQQS